MVQQSLSLAADVAGQAGRNICDRKLKCNVPTMQSVMAYVEANGLLLYPKTKFQPFFITGNICNMGEVYEDFYDAYVSLMAKLDKEPDKSVSFIDMIIQY